MAELGDRRTISRYDCYLIVDLNYLISLVVLRLNVKYRDVTIIQEPTTVSLNGASS
jgi:hypothetical protein